MENIRRIEAELEGNMKDILYPYVKKVCEKLSEIEDQLSLEEKISFEKLKSSIRIYELEKQKEQPS